MIFTPLSRSTVKSVLYGVRFTTKMPPIKIVRLQEDGDPASQLFYLFVLLCL